MRNARLPVGKVEVRGFVGCDRDLPLLDQELILVPQRTMVAARWKAHGRRFGEDVRLPVVEISQRELAVAWDRHVHLARVTARRRWRRRPGGWRWRGWRPRGSTAHLGELQCLIFI